VLLENGNEINAMICMRMRKANEMHFSICHQMQYWWPRILGRGMGVNDAKPAIGKFENYRFSVGGLVKINL